MVNDVAKVPGESSNDSILAYVALGCNLGDRYDNLKSAVDALQALTTITQVQASSVYETSPMGPADQPDYLNAVVSLQTRLAPLELLDALQLIEQQHGRTRDGERWGPRTLDLDLLLYAECVIESPRLTVPHPGIADRSFVLFPLAELDSELVIPDKGPVAALKAQCQQFGIRRLNSLL